MAVEASIRHSVKTVRNKMPESLYESFVDQNRRVTALTKDTLKNTSRMRMKTWRVRSLRYWQILPEDIKRQDMNKLSSKSRLKKWVLKNILQDGDDIFKGKSKKKQRPQRRRTELNAEDGWLEDEANL